MVLVIVTLRAAFEVESVSSLESIGDAIREALEALRGEGAARVEGALLNEEGTLEQFARSNPCISDFEFELPALTKACIEFDT
jgi:hypothetical protein